MIINNAGGGSVCPSLGLCYLSAIGWVLLNFGFLICKMKGNGCEACLSLCCSLSKPCTRSNDLWVLTFSRLHI